MEVRLNETKHSGNECFRFSHSSQQNNIISPLQKKENAAELRQELRTTRSDAKCPDSSSEIGDTTR